MSAWGMLLVFLNSNSGAITAIATVVIAFFTATLWYITSKSVIRLERPVIFVVPRRARWHTSHIPNIPFIEYSIHNYGRAAAVIKHQRIDARVVKNLPDDPSYMTKQNFDWTAIAPTGGISDLMETINRGDDSEKLDYVRNGTRILLFSGIIGYEDAFGKKFTTRFGWIFHPSDSNIPHSNESFIACDKAGYNENT